MRAAPRWPGRVAPWLLAIGLLHLGSVASAEPLALAVSEARVPAGTYYVGRAMGERDYRALANASTSGFLVMTREVGQGLLGALSTWGTLHGYVFEAACAACDGGGGDKPVAGVSWRDAALLANALSEANGLDPVYRDKAGQPIRSAVPPTAIDHAVAEPTLSGFRLPTIPEWHIAMRGADKAMASSRYGAEPAAPNALGLMNTAGPLAEWTASSMDLGDGKTSYFACNAEVDGVRRLSNCELHGAGWSDASVAFRLVRRAPR